MDLEKRVAKLEKTTAVLESRIREQRKANKKIRKWADKISDLLQNIKRDPFGTRS